MVQKPFDRIDKADIDALVANAVREGRTVEYKQALTGNTDEDKREFLADVSSFANAAGGDLLFGVEEQRGGDGKTTGVPAGAPGLPGLNADAEIRRLENMVRDGIEPRIASVRLRPVEGFADGPVLLLRVPKSYAAPHMVTFKNLSRFFSRNSAGKYQLDVAEIRSAFAFSEALPERIRRFRDERLGRIVAGEVPFATTPGLKVVLHVLPVAALDPTARIDLTAVAESYGSMPPLFTGGYNCRYNFDGYICFDHDWRPDADAGSYVQLFRGGAIEAVFTPDRRAGLDDRLLPATDLERGLITGLTGYLRLQHELGLTPPFIVMLTLLGVQGRRIPRARLRDLNAAIDRDALLLPDCLVDDHPAEADRVLRPAFDALWQAAGWPRCQNYDEAGKWAAR